MAAPKDTTVRSEGQPAGCSLQKSLAMATLAASLGMALGVDVEGALAAERQLYQTPNEISRQHKMLESNQMKDTTNQVQQSQQHKIDQSRQIKLDTQQPPQSTFGR